MSLLLTIPNDELISRFNNLQSREDIVNLLDITDYQLRYYLYILGVEKCYTKFSLPKKSGGYREIMAPNNSLRIIQSKLSQVFSAVYIAKAPVHGFVIDRSVVTNARMHLRQKFVFNLDLENFFPSINFGRVRGLLMSKPYNCHPTIATILAQICCVNNNLPQGAPTSPIISNMICAPMDSQLRLLAQRHNCIYTRYADDITFSTSISRFPKGLAHYVESTGQISVGGELQKAIEANGFRINDSKVRLQTRYQRQEVTGIIVNSKLNVGRKYVRQIRAMLHAWRKFGLEEAAKTYQQNFALKYHKPGNGKPPFEKIVRGKIEYLGMVRGKDDLIYLRFCTQLKELAPNLVKDSIFAHLTQDMPLLPCPMLCTEGKTDLIHLKAALAALQTDNNFVNLKVSFKDDLDEGKQGSAELLNMCRQLSKVTQANPIIAIFDRDEPNIIKQVIDETKEYKDWGNNVYSFALPIPSHRTDTPDICIELYYRDDMLQRIDQNGNRLFLSSEFTRNGKHKQDTTISTTELNKVKSKLTIIDQNVFDFIDKEEKNIALSKNIFAENIINKQQGFHDFDFGEFQQIFAIIREILLEGGIP